MLNSRRLVVSCGHWTGFPWKCGKARFWRSSANPAAAKTTLARAVLGLQPLKSGRIDLLGQKVHGVLHHQAEKVGIVWQDPYASSTQGGA